MKKTVLVFASHTFIGVVGFFLGLYYLPILMAPASLSEQQVAAMLGSPEFKGTFRRDLKDSDFLHWGEGIAHVSRSAIYLEGELSPGPDYKMYLSPKYIETEQDFLRLKESMVKLGDVNSFTNPIVAVPRNVDVRSFNTVIVWCETFSQFITATKYR